MFIRIILSCIVVTLAFWASCILCEHEIFAKFHQKDYKVKDVRMELLSFNDKYINHIRLFTYKYNRSTPAVNGSVNFKIDNLQDKMQSLIQGYKFSSNQYRPFPIHYQSDFCAPIDNNVMGLQTGMRKCGNITECKFKKNTTYNFCKFVLDASQLPPLIPTGMYKIDVLVMYDQDIIYSVAMFGEVYRKF